MASAPLTRTTRRSEALSLRPNTRNNVASHLGNNRQPPPLQQSNVGRKKRPRDSLGHEDESIIKKKAKIAIEISAQPKAQPKTRSLTIKSNNSVVAPQRPPSPPRRAAEIATPTETPPRPPPYPKPTKNHEKVVNGIRHELDRLHPSPKDVEHKDEKRKLRSQESTRFKSELSAYFPEYDEVIGNEPKEEHILNFDTPIIISDSAKPKQATSPRKANVMDYPLAEFPDDLFATLNDAQRVDHSFLDKHFKEEGGKDPLSHTYFESIHKKPERLEKSIRNTDRGRAQHERGQVIGLLERLQGHDWLKLLGVSGVTDTIKREYEPKRDYFIRGCEAIIEKFRTWKEEEKRRKLEKEAAIAEAEEAAEAEDKDQEIEDEDEGNVSDGDPPDYSDVDVSAARQLHEEAVARSAPAARVSQKRPKIEFIASPPQKEFRSFFKKPHARKAALGNPRRSGRTNVEAWGHPVPDIPVAEFNLPEDFRDEDTLRTRERSKRRARRVSKG